MSFCLTVVEPDGEQLSELDTRDVVHPLKLLRFPLTPHDLFDVFVSECHGEASHRLAAPQVQFVKERVDQVNQHGKHGRQRAQKYVSHAVVVVIFRHPAPAVPSHRLLRFVFLIPVPRRLPSPRRRSKQSAGSLIKPLLFLLQFPPYMGGLRLAETGVSFWEKAWSNKY